jgi:hypothetical protein
MTANLSTQIAQKYQIERCYHMTHIQNLPSILEAKELCSYNRMRGQTYLNLSNEDVQSGRATITIGVSGRPLHDLDFLDISAIRRLRYAYSEVQRRKKQAEVLVPDSLSLSHLTYITCYSESTKTRILDIWRGSGINDPSIQVNPGWYF